MTYGIHISRTIGNPISNHSPDSIGNVTQQKKKTPIVLEHYDLHMNRVTTRC